MTATTRPLSAADTARLVGSGQAGTIYLLHFDQPFQHARHYLGWASDLDRRLAMHGKSDGSALMRAVAAAGITWRLARTWPGDRHRERQLKHQGGRTRLCPICRADAAGQRSLFDPPTAPSEGAPIVKASDITPGGRYLVTVTIPSGPATPRMTTVQEAAVVAVERSTVTIEVTEPVCVNAHDYPDCLSWAMLEGLLRWEHRPVRRQACAADIIRPIEATAA